MSTGSTRRRPTFVYWFSGTASSRRSATTGSIHLLPGLAGSRIELQIPVDRLVVDDAEMRRQEGGDFTSQPSESDISGTRSNMLSAALLNAKQFPTTRVTGTSGRVDAGKSAAIDLTVELIGHEIRLTLPATLKLEGNQLEASGEIDLTHNQLGLKPFTALLGSLRVADRMKFKYRIRASKEAK